jgi:hypothetical protein
MQYKINSRLVRFRVVVVTGCRVLIPLLLSLKFLTIA